MKTQQAEFYNNKKPQPIGLYNPKLSPQGDVAKKTKKTNFYLDIDPEKVFQILSLQR